VEPLGIENTGKLATVLYETSTNVELQISNELSSLKAMDFYGTISLEKSTGNAPKKLSTHIRNGIMPHLWGINLSHIYAREVR
jgi:hypothetical protein